MSKTKACSLCKEQKALEHFNVCRSRRDGLSERCKSCHRTAVAISRAKKHPPKPFNVDTEQHLHLVPRYVAKAYGLKKYFTGQPCKHGGVSQRRSANNQCLCEKCRQEAMGRCADWWSENREEAIAKKRQEYAESPSRAIESARRYRAENPDKTRASYRSYMDRNPHKISAKGQKRRAMKRNRIPTWFGELDALVLEEAADLAQHRRAATGVDWHIDHLVPMLAKKASGLHCAANLQVIPAFMNLRKGNRMWLTEPDAWLSELSP